MKVYGHFLDTLEKFWTLDIFWKVSGHYGKFTDTMENFPDTLQSSRTLWKCFRTSRKVQFSVGAREKRLIGRFVSSY